jgi:UDPglucose 6-dehydrogenase
MALASIARQAGSPSLIVESVIAVNEQQRLAMIPKIERLVQDLGGKTVAVLGLAFKPETDDVRDAPAMAIIKGLLARGARVRAYDPVAMAAAGKIFPDIEYASDEYDAARGADVLVLVTEWNQFRALDMKRIRDSMNAPRIADLRNVYEPGTMRDLGFEYVGVGR